MRYLHLGSDQLIPKEDVIGIFDLDNCSTSVRTREFLRKTEKKGKMKTISTDLPTSFVLHRNGDVYLSPISPAALNRRMEETTISE